MSFRALIRKYYIFRPVLWAGVLWNYERSTYNKRVIRRSPTDQLQYERCIPWFAINGDETLRLEYDLSADSIVFDVGGYKGEFASSIFDKYGCKVYIFEPLPAFYAIIKNRFSNNKRIKAFCVGLSDKTGSENISVTDDKSSLFINANKTTIELKRAVDFIREQQILKIDLMKVNIEGAEYDLLDDLIGYNEISKIKNLQVQFHDFIVPDAKNRMAKIQAALSKTHELTYQFEFVWENWRLKE